MSKYIVIMGKPLEKKAVMKRLDALVKRLEDGADLFVSRNLKTTCRTKAKSQTRHITLNADKLQ